MLNIPLAAVRKLLGSGAGDAALLYLYLQTGADVTAAAETLHWQVSRVDAAFSSLRQLGLYAEEKDRPIIRAQPPVYTEQDVMRASERGFGLLVGEAQRRLGRILSTEEMKILLSLTDYLGLPTEVIGMIITYCIERSRARGQTRVPSIRTIEKEAYHWADEGIDTLESAAFYVQTNLQKHTDMRRIQSRLQLDGRKLTRGEETYILSWLDMGFGEGAIGHAYEKTCINTGAMKWPYCNSILKRWHEKNLHTLAEIEAGDVRPDTASGKSRPPVGTAGQSELSELERKAVAQLLKEGREERI